MPLSHAVLLLGAYFVLAADEVPRFDYEATCRAPLLHLTPEQLTEGQV